MTALAERPVLPVDWAERVVAFWFDDLSTEQWFKVDPRLDAAIREKFEALHTAVATADVAELTRDAVTALATVIVLDQFPRNMHRGTPRAFANDPQALAVARHAVDMGFDAALTLHQRLFLYLPFEHSEDLADQRRSLALIAALGDDRYTDYARRHLEIVERFGRFPHRNRILGRTSSADELAFLAEPGSSF